MSQQTITTTPHNSGSGDPLNTAFEKCNANFTELYGRLAADVRQYGVIGNGVVDDTTALLSAASAGIDLFIAGGLNLKITGGITFGAGQKIYGSGAGDSKITPVGNFDVFTWNNGVQGGGAEHLTINAAGMTGGNTLVVNSANRVRFDRLLILSPYNGIYVTTCNLCSVRDVWMNGATGSYCIQWFGNNSQRSDVLDIANVQVSGSGSPSASSPVGLIMDGNVDTCDIRHFGAVNVLRGIHIKNSSGGSAPQFLSGYDIQVDFAYDECVRIEGSMRTALFTDMYLHASSTADNLYIDSTVQHVSWQGGKNDSAFQRGGYLNGRYIYITDVQCSTNSQQGSGTWAGWEIGANSIGVRILGGLAGQWTGYATEKQSYGVVVDSGASTYTVLGVNLLNNVIGQYQDNANDVNSWIMPTQTGGNLTLTARGVSVVNLGNETNGVGFSAQASDATTVNFLRAFGHAAGSAAALGSVGGDTNIDIDIVPKGTGNVQFGNAASFSANGSVATALTSVGPTGSHTTVQTWLTIKDNGGTVRYIPCF